MSLAQSSDTTSSHDIYYAHSWLNKALTNDAVPASNAGRGRHQINRQIRNPFAHSVTYLDEAEPANLTNAAIC
jgi:hypothetical protein